MQFKAPCFELLLWDAALVWSSVGRNIQPVNGIGTNMMMYLGSYWSVLVIPIKKASNGCGDSFCPPYVYFGWMIVHLCFWQVDMRPSVSSEALAFNWLLHPYLCPIGQLLIHQPLRRVSYLKDKSLLICPQRRLFALCYFFILLGGN